MSQRPPAAGSLAEWLAYQEQLHERSIDLTLERVREVARRLDLTTPACPVAIVGGTNGKGSTAAALAALLSACGRRVGLFTSPHLVRYNERIRIAGREASDAELTAAFERVETGRGDVSLTLFEFSTLAALLLFREAAVDAMVLEVGLGGRLDATNIIDADVAILCSVGLDHRDWLGETVEQIGAEKAGIFRAGRPVVLGSVDLPQSVWSAARRLQCRIQAAQREFSWRIEGDGYAFEPWHYQSESCVLHELAAPGLRGPVQYANAAAAITALQFLSVDGACQPQRTSQGLRGLALPGRLQVVAGEVEWILDVAHNEAAAQVLAAALVARPARGRSLAVAGVLADKDAAAIARALDPLIDVWMLTGIDDPLRGAAAEQLAARLPPLRGSTQCVPTVAAACAQARALARAGDRIVVLGSFHVVGPALSWLELY